ncbi:hypothetical protein D3C87_81840 [compost metagenome]
MGIFDKIAKAFGSVNSGNKGKGPIVKTGPTAGNVRSRNLDGRWRAKRSDAGIPRKK